ncbi:uncharacterized protein LOC21399605 [Morus notabilis]|uniref:uncharacterized protein LOC21399605 n=1 Tax=Morus notabilis TaxID=981085 RepID=UPI000CED217C|nr:uncharacterized protein LOC21399605 [Morus notabilis]XP_024017292.1 uncharacterized protein LOC21399605 [Morus notabilis]
MERVTKEVSQDENDTRLKGEAAELIHNEANSKEVPKPSISVDNKQVKMVRGKGRQEVSQDASPAGMYTPGEVNMEASIIADDVIRAGGFGARDDISSFLPVASDSTDFEAMILGAREYEEPQGEISRPGLGWKGTTETK